MRAWLILLTVIFAVILSTLGFLGLKSKAPTTSALAASSGSASAGSASSGSTSVDNRALIQVEKRVFELTNQERRQRGLPALQDEKTLTEIARQHSYDMLRRRFFDHVNPDRESASDRVAAGHRRLIGLNGENIWSGSGQDQRDVEKLAQIIVEGWMTSPGHRENILRPAFTHLGVAVAASGKEIRATQSFATVLAYLNQPLPEVLKRGATPDLRMRMVASNQASAERFDLWSPSRRQKVTQPMPIDEPAFEAPSDIYWLRFHFPDEQTSDARTRRFQVFFGPRFELR